MVNNRYRNCTLSSVLIGLIALTGCGSPNDSVDTSCSGHGEFHGDHCDCYAGYVATEDRLSCEPEQHEHSDDHTGQTGQVEAEELVFTASSAQGSVGEAQDGSKVWLFEAMDGDKILRIELYAGYGALTSPGVVDITANETDYATCGTCIMLRTGCVAHNDHYDCSATFMPRAEGRVHIDAIGSTAGEQLTGELKDIMFQQVSIGQNYTTTPIAEGAQRQLEAWSFDVQLEALDSK